MSAPEVVVIDYGVGNLLSVQRGLEHVGAKVTLTANPKLILSSSRVVLPGVGAFANAMQAIDQLGLIDVIRELSHRQTPLLGICLGMQLLMDQSEEFGITAGLGLIPGRVAPIPTHSTDGLQQKIPHIGWNALQPARALANWDGSLLQDIKPGEAAYFVHSYMVVTENAAHCLAECKYGGHLITAAIARNQIMGCQFHPEKSGEVGLRILRRFIQL